MKTVEKHKLCPNCEARVPLEATLCPFCASELNMEAPRSSTLFQSQTLEDSVASLYTPPYQSSNRSASLSHSSAESSLYKKNAPAQQPQAEAPVERKSSLVPSILMFAGSTLLLLGLMLVIFAREGTLQLEWDASYWFIYALIGAPLLYFGYRKLSELD